MTASEKRDHARISGVAKAKQTFPIRGCGKTETLASDVAGVGAGPRDAASSCFGRLAPEDPAFFCGKSMTRRVIYMKHVEWSYISR
jgi:hypothetical protein